MRVALKSALIVLLFCACAWSQVATSQIGGVVQDAAGAAVAGAQVNIIQEGTGTARAVVSGANGSYVAPNLSPGTYRLQVTKAGFKQMVYTGIVLNVASNPEINVKMVAGSPTEQVVAEATGGMVEAHAGGGGQVINSQSVSETPLNGRQVQDLVTLAPGAVVNTNDTSLNSNSNYPTQTLSIGGGLTGGTSYLLDGASNNDPINNQSLPQPFPDALQQLKVQTGSIPAQYGHHAAAAVNMVTKAGSNQLHGDAFEFLRNGDLNARDYFATSRDTLKRNQFGGVVGGAIKKNKIFFFMGYQGTIVKSDPPTTTAFIPSAAMVAGDFTAFASAGCQGKNITLAAPFVNNKVDPSLFSKAALAMTKKMPISQASPCGAIQYGMTSDTNEQMGVGRLDYDLSKKQKLFFRYLISRYAAPVQVDTNNVLTYNKAGLDDQAESGVFGHTYSFKSNLTASFHAAVIRSRVNRNIQNYFSPADLGSNTYSPIKGFMDMTVSSGFSLGTGANNPGYFNSTGYQVGEDFNWQKNRHQIQFGFVGIRTIMNTVNNRLTNGTFSFTSTTGCAGCTGLSLADFMVGTVSGGFTQGTSFWDNDRSWIFGLYAQDSWKINRHFAVSYGVRWEPFLPETNWNHFVEHFDAAAFAAGTKSTVYTNAPAGMTFPGDPGYPGNSNMFGHKLQFAPRLSAVWDPKGDGKQTLRAAYGIFYDTPPLFFFTRVSNNPPWGAQTTLPLVNFDNPWSTFPGGNPFPGQAQLSKTETFPLAGVYVNTPLHTKATYMQQWSLIWERQINKTLMLGAGYFGNTTTHQWTGYEANPAMPVAGATLASENQHRKLYLQNPAQGQYFATMGMLDDGGKAEYHALQLRAEQRMSHNVSLNANYSWAHCIGDPPTQQLTGPTYINPDNRAASRANCSADRRQVFNLTPTYMTPRITNALLGKIVGRWTVSTIFRVQTGNYSTVVDGSDVNLTGIGNQRPNNIGGSVYLAQTTPGNASKFAVQYLNAVSATVPSGISKGAFSTTGIGVGQWGNSGAYVIRNPGLIQLDARISRVFRLAERKTAEFRWEIFNVPNLVNLGAPNVTLNSASFGQITTDQNGGGGQTGDPRIMQGAIKFVF